jgi:enolase
MIAYWGGWCDKYPIRSIEDGLAETTGKAGSN